MVYPTHVILFAVKKDQMKGSDSAKDKIYFSCWHAYVRMHTSEYKYAYIYVHMTHTQFTYDAKEIFFLHR